MKSRPIAALIFCITLGQPLGAQQWQMPQADDPATQELGAEAPGDAIGQQLEGLMGQIFDRLQPHLEGLGNELSATVNEFSPALNELSGLVDDFANYHAPERLPNGDVILRRRADAPPPPSTEELQKLLPEREAGEQDAPAPEGWTPPADSPPMPQTEL